MKRLHKDLTYWLAEVSTQKLAERVLQKLEEEGIPDPGLDVLDGLKDNNYAPNPYILRCTPEFHLYCSDKGIVNQNAILKDHDVLAWRD